MRKRVLSAIFACVFAVGLLAGCANSGQNASGETKSGKRIWKFAHTRAEGTDNDKLANEFADKLTSQMDNLQINIYPNNQLGDYTVVQECAGMGEIQLMLGSMSPSVNSTLSVQIAPYLATSWDEAMALYNSNDGMVYQYVSGQLKKENIKLLAVIPKYFGAIMTTKPAKNIETPGAKKGLKIRVPQQKAFEEFGTAIGFSTTPLPTSDTFTALQTGVVDGVSGGGAEQYWNDYGELCKYLYCTKTHMECHWIYMSMDTWKTLSAEEKQIVQKSAKEIEDEAFKLAKSNEKKYIKLFKEKGVEVYEPGDKVIDDYRNYVRKKVWPKIGSEYGSVWGKLSKKIQNQ